MDEEIGASIFVSIFLGILLIFAILANFVISSKNPEIYYVTDTSGCTWKGELYNRPSPGLFGMKDPELVSGNCLFDGTSRITIAYSNYWKE